MNPDSERYPHWLLILHSLALFCFTPTYSPSGLHASYRQEVKAELRSLHFNWKSMTYSFPLNNALLVLTIVVVLLPAQTYAFGAGDIPDFAYLNGSYASSLYMTGADSSMFIYAQQTRHSVMETLKMFSKPWPKPQLLVVASWDSWSRFLEAKISARAILKRFTLYVLSPFFMIAMP